MFTITKLKGKAYKTDSPENALRAYQNKKSLSMYHDQTVIRTKCGTGEHSGRLNQQYLERF